MPKVRYGQKKGLVPTAANNGNGPPEDDNSWRRTLTGHYTEENARRPRERTRKHKKQKRSKREATRRRSLNQESAVRRRSRSAPGCTRSPCKSRARYHEHSDAEVVWTDYYDDEPLEGVAVEPAPTHQIEYSPPIYNLPNLGRTDDEELDRELQQQVDAAVYADSDDYMAMADTSTEYVQLEEVEQEVEEAFNEGEWGNNDDDLNAMVAAPQNNVEDVAGDIPANGGDPDDYDDNQAVLVHDGGEGDQAEVAIVAGDENPDFHSIIEYESGRWITQVYSRAPHFTDLLWDHGYVRGPAGYFRVPWVNVWTLVAMANLGQGGWGYSVRHVTTVFYNDGFGPI